MVAKKRRKRGCNDTCMECGKWATEVCAYCKRPVCDEHARLWPHPRPGEKGTLADATRRIITCANRKCQMKLPDSARRAAVEAFKEIVDVP
jgi:hypothetical protein